MKLARTIAVACLALATPGCGSDDGNGDDKLDPGREVGGCFDCTGSEYCMLIDTDSEADRSFCASNSCGDDCDCLMDDAARRHEECSSSCQHGSGIVYCAR
jgi:hypothetical protein